MNRADRIAQILALIAANDGFANTVAIVEAIRENYADKSAGWSAAFAAINAAERQGLIFRRVLCSVRREGRVIFDTTGRGIEGYSRVGTPSRAAFDAAA